MIINRAFCYLSEQQSIMNEQKIISLYQDYKESEIKGFDLVDEFVPMVKKEPNLLSVILDLFHMEHDIEYKLRLADVLAVLQCREIEFFLLALSKNGTRDLREGAAYDLVILNNRYGQEALLALIDEYEKNFNLEHARRKAFSEVYIITPDKYKNIIIFELNEINNDYARETIKLISSGKTYDEVMAPQREERANRLKNNPETSSVVRRYETFSSFDKHQHMIFFEESAISLIEKQPEEIYGLLYLFEREKDKMKKAWMGLILARFGKEEPHDFLKKMARKFFCRFDTLYLSAIGLVWYQDSVGEEVLRSLLPEIAGDPSIREKTLERLQAISNDMASRLIDFIATIPVDTAH